MTELNQIYKCGVCGNIVEMVHSGKGQLVCCGQPMKLQEANTVDAALEKHVPVIDKTENGISVKVGTVLHPMTDEHYIEWIEVITSDGKVYRQQLTPAETPEAHFTIDEKNILEVREYCNLHGLWKK